MASFDALKVGDVLYDVSREKAGNTTLRRTVVRSCVVKELNVTGRLAFISWNGNSPTWWSERKLKPLRRTKPKVSDPLSRTPIAHPLPPSTGGE